MPDDDQHGCNFRGGDPRVEKFFRLRYGIYVGLGGVV